MNRRPPRLLLATATLALACTGKTDAADTAGPTVEAAPVEPAGRLKIEEVFYTGSIPTAGIDRYYADQFIQLRNISSETVQLGGVVIGNVHGLAGEINPGYEPDALADDPDLIYFSNLWQIPGDPDEVLLAPGDCVRIAQDAADHNPYSTLDHLDAHYETYVERSSQDTDNPLSENLVEVFYTGGNDWLITVFGPTVVIASPEVVDQSRSVNLDWTWVLEIPASGIIDSMEALMDADSGDYKRLHPDIDAGFIHASGTYTGESVRRIATDDGLQDTDDSAADFTLSQPVVDCSAR